MYSGSKDAGMSPQAQKLERLHKLRELLARRAAVQREIRVIETKLQALTSAQLRKAS